VLREGAKPLQRATPSPAQLRSFLSPLLQRYHQTSGSLDFDLSSIVFLANQVYIWRENTIEILGKDQSTWVLHDQI